MSTQFQSIFDAALLLPESERGELAARLMDTFDDDSEEAEEAAMAEELQRRIDDGTSGRIQTIPFEVVLRRMQEDIDAARS